MSFYSKEVRSAHKRNRRGDQGPRRRERIIRRKDVQAFVEDELRRLGAVPTDFSSNVDQPPETGFRKDLLS